MPASPSLSLRRFIKLLLALALVAGLVSPFVNSQTANAPIAATPTGGEANVALHPANGASPTAIEGWVRDSGGRPVPRAVVALGSYRATSDWGGYFSFGAGQLPLPTGSPNDGFTYVEASVSAHGYADWSISQVRYYPGDILRLYPRLNPASAAPSHFTAARPQVGASQAPAAGSTESEARASLASVLTLGNSGGESDIAAGPQSAGLASVASAPAVPAQIRVYRTATGDVEVVPFKEYVKHVLPNEWISSWAPASLRAGAMAVKEYAWFWIARGGKQTALDADVKDNTDDQVYDPNVSYASTDAAVDATWQYSMTRSGALFQASYCAGTYQADPAEDCPWDNFYMTQWGSKYHADQGRTWSWIVRFYFPGVIISPTPPGGDGAPPPAAGGPPTAQPIAAPTFTVGQGAVQPTVFQEAYERYGGAQALGNPTGAVRWWLPYVSENNVLAQPFAGDGKHGAAWLVFDTLKSNVSGINRAYLLSGNIADAYSSNTPPGPEWVGAPTSDPYIALTNGGGLASQGFTKGTLTFDGNKVQFTPWPQQFSGWEAEYFVGKPPFSVQTGPAPSLPGQPANIVDVPAPNMDWSPEVAVPKSLGLGSADWSVQFSRTLETDPGSYDFVITADSGVRFWVDGMLAINAWDASGPHRESYNANLDSNAHEIRIQYFSPGSAASLDFIMTERGKAQAPQAVPGTPPGASGQASLRVKVSWLGRAPAPNDTWAQPLTLSLSVPGNPAPVGSYPGATDRNGVAIYNNLPAGTYDVHVKGAHSLQNARAGIVLASNQAADVDMKALVEGDVDGDNCVTVDDFAVVQAMVGTDKNTPGYNSAADLNGDGQVTVADVSLLRSGFDRCGDISADNDLSALSTDTGPTLSEALSPWLNSDALQRNLALGLIATNSAVREGNTIQVAVVANASGQPIDGASFVLRYDPASLAPVDASGNATTLSEPGLALPSVLTNWVDPKGGAIGYAAAVLQGAPPSGQVVLTTLTFRALKGGPTSLSFAPAPSGLMQMTNGGVNLLASAAPLTLTVTP